MVWDGERSGLCSTGHRGIIGSTIARLRPNGSVDSHYLSHQMAAAYTWIQAQRTGTGIPHVPKDLATRLLIPLPLLPEQRRIAHLLDTTDAAIRGTEAVIAKLEQVKEGLLHDLLTRGLDEDGCLRPTHERAPELYRETDIGRVPRGWATARIEDLLGDRHPAMRSGPFGSSLKKEQLTDDPRAGWPLLGIENVEPGKYVDTFTRVVPQRLVPGLLRYEVLPGDVLVTIMGTVGRSCVVPHGIPRTLSSKHVWAISLDSKLYRQELVAAQINWASWVSRQFSSMAQGSTMPAISSETLRRLRIPWPPMDEQDMIHARWDGILKRIGREGATASKLRNIRRGLMHDLLTGRVRVPEGIGEEVATA